MGLPNQLLQMLSLKLAAINTIGSLSNLRQVVEECNFNSKQQVRGGYSLVGSAHLVGFDLAECNGRFAVEYFYKARNFVPLPDLLRLAIAYDQPDTISLLNQIAVKESIPSLRTEKLGISNWSPKKTRVGVDETFRKYCHDHQLVILRTLQQGLDSSRRCSWVYLVWDTDGITKVYKEILDYSHLPYDMQGNHEDELYTKLPEQAFFPKYYGTVQVDDFQFMRQSVHFGQTLADFTLNQPSISPEDSKWVIRGVAQAIDLLHQNHIIHLDLKPENILVHPDGVKLLDLGISRYVTSPGEQDTFLADPRFGTYEGITRHKADYKSDVYQLGILYYKLITGTYPNEIPELQAGDTNALRESSILKYLWPRAVLPIDCSDLDLPSKDKQVLERMLDPNPVNRIDAAEIVDQLKSTTTIFIHHSPRITHQKTKNSVLFPARMGIPHRGHIEYMCRILELGYHLIVDIENNHVITPRDPIHKFFVMKMVAKSLVDRGFSPNTDFSFVFTPLYKSDEELSLHYQTIPHIEDVVAIASSNPNVHMMFPGWAIFDQASVFGSEGEWWPDRSWGEYVRQGIRENNYSLFTQYVATGVESILSFDTLRNMYDQPHIEYAENVITSVSIGDDHPPIQGRAFQFQSAEQSIIHHLCSHKYEVKVIDPYTQSTRVKVNGRDAQLVYKTTTFEPTTLQETVHFNLEWL